MIFLRKILFPFAVLYGWITQLRNFLFDKGFFKSHSFNMPVVAVGNLSVGGTGKTPQIEYLIRLLSPQYKVATLSRGYKRQSEGFILADQTTTAAILGDEPFQFYQKFQNIAVAVDADRKNGIEKLLLLPEKPEVVLLDDAFQHRKVRAGFYILLTAYGDLFYDDCMLPTGNLRESKKGVKRADVLIVTKCPSTISEKEQQEIRTKAGVKSVFFSSIAYDDSVYSTTHSIKVTAIRNSDKLLIAGIAKPESFFFYLKSENDTILTFPDHHHFDEKDIADIKDQAAGRLIVTTEKDYVRMKDNFSSTQLFYLPIRTSFIADGETFDRLILDYVEKFMV